MCCSLKLLKFQESILILKGHYSYFLRKLTSFTGCSKVLEITYQSVVASAFFSSVVSRLNKLIKKASFGQWLQSSCC